MYGSQECYLPALALVQLGRGKRIHLFFSHLLVFRGLQRLFLEVVCVGKGDLAGGSSGVSWRLGQKRGGGIHRKSDGKSKQESTGV